MTPIDLTRLRDFSDGTEPGLRDLAALFVTHMEECLLAIRRAVDGRDSEVIRSEAHRGAGTAGPRFRKADHADIVTGSDRGQMQN